MDKKPITSSHGESIAVVVGSVADCVNTPPTLKAIEETAQELGLPIHVTRQIVTTQEEAVKYRFIGSPTVQIDGLDLQREMRSYEKYGFT